MVVILGIAGAATAAITAYNRARKADMGRLSTRVGQIRQIASVFIAVSNAVRAVLDALQGINRNAQHNNNQANRPSTPSGVDTGSNVLRIGTPIKEAA